MLLDMILFAAFSLITVSFVNQEMLRLGILAPFFTGKGEFRLPMQDVLHVKDVAFYFSIFSGILLVNAVFKYKKYAADDQSQSIEHLWPVIRLRFLGGMTVFVVPMIISLAAGNYAPISLDMRNVLPSGNITLESGIELVQPFYPSSADVTRIGFRFGTYGRFNKCTVTVEIRDEDTVLFQQNMNPEEWVDGDVVILDCPLSGLTPEQIYTIHLTSPDATVTDAVAVWYGDVQPNCVSTNINGIQQEYQLITFVG